MYKQLSSYINLSIKKQHVFLLGNYNLYLIHTFQEYKNLFLLKSINKQPIQYLIIDL